ncbi:hypothetical protein VPH35_072739 [Triticum aestivum]|uniref:Uncharacterized protein n=1 Tax=Triticum turgidum subsp. durum TaxID=4567 RepID=A0A9R0T576_TRITD|nr:unnamed protein product [Triticum turgidum subsp. durum]
MTPCHTRLFVALSRPRVPPRPASGDANHLRPRAPPHEPRACHVRQLHPNRRRSLPPHKPCTAATLGRSTTHPKDVHHRITLIPTATKCSDEAQIVPPRGS